MNTPLKLKQRIYCMRQIAQSLQDEIMFLRSKVPGCCQPPEPSSSSSQSSSSTPECIPPTQDIYDEWIWSEGITTSGIGAIEEWEGRLNGKVLTSLPGRPDERRAKIQDGAIFSNGAEGFKTAYQASLPSDWYSGSDTAYGNALFFVIEIDLFKIGETILWNHLMSGGYDNFYNSFTTQTSTNSIGTRTNGTYFSITRPSWMLAGVKRYLVEMRYGDSSSISTNDFQILINGYPVVTTFSPHALREILGLGIVAPMDYAANSSLDRRLLSILALQGEDGFTDRLSLDSIDQAREYMACVWNIELQN